MKPCKSKRGHEWQHYFPGLIGDSGIWVECIHCRLVAPIGSKGRHDHA